MSSFGRHMARASPAIVSEFGDTFSFEPMMEVVNSEPIPDVTRSPGDVKAIITIPGITLGVGWALAGALHARSSEEPNIFYLSRGVLADVRKFDRFTLTDGDYTYADSARRFEVSDGPQPIGFGWWKVKLVVLPLIEGMAEVVFYTEIPPLFLLIN